MDSRRIALIAACAAVALVAVPRAQSAVGYQSLTVSSTAVGIDAGVRTDATRCSGTLETAGIRIAYNGATPTSTSGQPLGVGDELILGNRNDIVNFKGIAATALSGVLNMTCSSGTPPAASVIRVAPVRALPVGVLQCNALLKAAGQC